MKLSELLPMAAHNLWTRRSRTVFNAFGIVVSCALLLLVLSGTRGARNGLMNLFEKSEFATKLAILPGRLKSTGEQTAEASIEIESGISADREARLKELLEKDWERKNLPRAELRETQLEILRQTPPLTSVLPTQDLSCQLAVDEQRVAARVGCFSLADNQLANRIVLGEPPAQQNSRGRMWIGEFRAYQMGFRTDAQLRQLVGSEVRLRFNRPGSRPTAKLKKLSAAFGMPVSRNNEIDQIAETLRKLFAAVDDTPLNDLEKEIVRQTAQLMGLDDKPNPLSDDPAESRKQAEPPDQSDRFLFRDFIIAGIVKPPETTAASIFTVPRASRSSELMIDWRDFTEIDQATNPDRKNWYCIATVAKPADLGPAVAAVESQGFETRSALSILERADEELWKVRLIISALALVILLIAAVGIMNTMIIAVMERTPEFGIMKAVGAQNADIRSLMLLEAAMTGLLGVSIAIVVARGIDLVASQFARQYIESKLRQDFEFSIFIYTWGDMLLVTFIAISVCTLASLIPSNRAAKLDPVVAMRSR